jgi:hypothetical protein
MTPRVILTVNEILTATHVGGHYHDLPVNGGFIRVFRADFPRVLEAAWDPTDPNWFREIDFDSGCPELPRQELR